MKKCTWILVTCLLIIASQSHAKITCSKPKLSKPVNQGSVYHFKAEVTCSLVDEKITLASLKDAYLNDIVKRSSQFRVHAQTAYNNDQKNLSGYSLAVTQSFDTSHGYMKVRADVIIADDQKENFYYEFRSKSIDAKNNAKYDKAIHNITKLVVTPNNSELILVKEIDVEEPWYAPDSMFFGAVEPELSDSIRHAALVNARKICGEEVDALRKY